MYRVADTKGGLRRGAIVKDILYCVADTKGGLRAEGFVKGMLYRVWSKGEGYCYADKSGIYRLVLLKT